MPNRPIRCTPKATQSAASSDQCRVSGPSSVTSPRRPEKTGRRSAGFKTRGFTMTVRSESQRWYLEMTRPPTSFEPATTQASRQSIARTTIRRNQTAPRAPPVHSEAKNRRRRIDGGAVGTTRCRFWAPLHHQRQRKSHFFPLSAPAQLSQRSAPFFNAYT